MEAERVILPRSVVRTFRCPYCRAVPGQLCVGWRGKDRESNHKERVLAAGGTL